jgi:hypothetical protein
MPLLCIDLLKLNLFADRTHKAHCGKQPNKQDKTPSLIKMRDIGTMQNIMTGHRYGRAAIHLIGRQFGKIRIQLIGNFRFVPKAFNFTAFKSRYNFIDIDKFSAVLI